MNTDEHGWAGCRSRGVIGVYPCSSVFIRGEFQSGFTISFICGKGLNSRVTSLYFTQK